MTAQGAPLPTFQIMAVHVYNPKGGWTIPEGGVVGPHGGRALRTCIEGGIVAHVFGTTVHGSRVTLQLYGVRPACFFRLPPRWDQGDKMPVLGEALKKMGFAIVGCSLEHHAEAVNFTPAKTGQRSVFPYAKLSFLRFKDLRKFSKQFSRDSDKQNLRRLQDNLVRQLEPNGLAPSTLLLPPRVKMTVIQAHPACPSVGEHVVLPDGRDGRVSRIGAARFDSLYGKCFARNVGVAVTGDDAPVQCPAAQLRQRVQHVVAAASPVWHRRAGTEPGVGVLGAATTVRPGDIVVDLLGSETAVVEAVALAPIRTNYNSARAASPLLLAEHFFVPWYKTVLDAIGSHPGGWVRVGGRARWLRSSELRGDVFTAHVDDVVALPDSDSREHAPLLFCSYDGEMFSNRYRFPVASNADDTVTTIGAVLGIANDPDAPRKRYAFCLERLAPVSLCAVGNAKCAGGTVVAVTLCAPPGKAICLVGLPTGVGVAQIALDTSPRVLRALLFALCPPRRVCAGIWAEVHDDGDGLWYRCRVTAEHTGPNGARSFDTCRDGAEAVRVASTRVRQAYFTDVLVGGDAWGAMSAPNRRLLRFWARVHGSWVEEAPGRRGTRVYVETPPFVFCAGGDTEKVFTEAVPAAGDAPACTLYVAHTEAALLSAFASFVMRSGVQLLLAFNAAFDINYLGMRAWLMNFMADYYEGSENVYESFQRVVSTWQTARNKMDRWRSLQKAICTCPAAGACSCYEELRSDFYKLFNTSDGSVPTRVRVLDRIPDKKALKRAFDVLGPGGKTTFFNVLTRLPQVPAVLAYKANALGSEDACIVSPGLWWECAMKFGMSLPNKGGQRVRNSLDAFANAYGVQTKLDLREDSDKELGISAYTRLFLDFEAGKTLKIAYYCVVDCDIVMTLSMQWALVEQLMSYARTSGIPVSDVFRTGSTMKTHLLFLHQAEKPLSAPAPAIHGVLNTVPSSAPRGARSKKAKKKKTKQKAHTVCSLCGGRDKHQLKADGTRCGRLHAESVDVSYRGGVVFEPRSLGMHEPLAPVEFSHAEYCERCPAAADLALRACKACGWVDGSYAQFGPIALTDFNSLYPNAISTENLGPGARVTPENALATASLVHAGRIGGVSVFNVRQKNPIDGGADGGREEYHNYKQHAYVRRDARPVSPALLRVATRVLGTEVVKSALSRLHSLDASPPFGHPSDLSVIYKALKRDRDEAKRRKRDATTPMEARRHDANQLACKVVANAVYGALALIISGYVSAPDVSETTTHVGRANIHKAARMAVRAVDMRTHGYAVRVLYGDTDSCFLQYIGATDPAAVLVQTMWRIWRAREAGARGGGGAAPARWSSPRAAREGFRAWRQLVTDVSMWSHRSIEMALDISRRLRTYCVSDLLNAARLLQRWVRCFVVGRHRDHARATAHLVAFWRALALQRDFKNVTSQDLEHEADLTKMFIIAKKMYSAQCLDGSLMEKGVKSRRTDSARVIKETYGSLRNVIFTTTRFERPRLLWQLLCRVLTAMVDGTLDVAMFEQGATCKERSEYVNPETIPQLLVREKMIVRCRRGEITKEMSGGKVFFVVCPPPDGQAFRVCDCAEDPDWVRLHGLPVYTKYYLGALKKAVEPLLKHFFDTRLLFERAILTTEARRCGQALLRPFRCRQNRREGVVRRGRRARASGPTSNGLCYHSTRGRLCGKA